MKLYKRILQSLGILAGTFLVGAGIAYAVQITVPSAPAAGYTLVSTSTGAYITVAASSTTNVYIDSNRVDSYTADGSILKPYKTITAANTAVSAATSITLAAYHITPGTYTEQSMTLPNIPLVIYGQGATIILLSGPNLGAGLMTIPNDISFYDPVIFGNVSETDTSQTNPHTFTNAFIAGNFNVKGNATFTGGAIVDQDKAAFPFLSQSASSTLIVQPNSITNFNGDNIQVVIQDNGTINLNDDNLQVSTSTVYALTATTTGSAVNINGLSLENFGTGGGINIQNGATNSLPNEISSAGLTLGVGTVNAINAGTAVSYVGPYTAFTLNGTRLYATGSGLSPLSFATLGVEGTTTLGINGGNVGIGTTTPSAPLSVNGLSAFGANGAEDVFIRGQASQSIAFNRNPNTGAMTSAGGFGYNILHTPSTTNTSDLLSFDAYNTAGTLVKTNALTINGAGNVGIGTHLQTGLLDVGGPPSSVQNHGIGLQETFTDTSSAADAGINVQLIANPASDSTAQFYGFYSEAGVSGSNAQNFTSTIGFAGQVGFYIDRGSGTVSNAAAFYAKSPAASGTGTTTNIYGLRIAKQGVSSQFTHSYGVFQEDAVDKNYFAGNVGIGTSSPISKLAVSGGSSIGADYNIAAPTNGLIVEGNVGIGTTTPWSPLAVQGTTYLKQSSLTLATSTTLNQQANFYNSSCGWVKVFANIAYETCNGASSLTAVNVSTPLNPQFIGQFHDTTNINGAEGFEISGNYAFVTGFSGNSLASVDISNPATMKLGSSITDAVNLNQAEDVQISGRYAFVVDDTATGRLTSVDISNPLALATTSSVVLTNCNGPSASHVIGQYDYIACSGSNYFDVVNIANPKAMNIAASFTDAHFSSPGGIEIKQPYVYLLNHGAASMVVVNISNPTSPTFVSSVTTPVVPWVDKVGGNYLYVDSATSGELMVFDISSSTSPFLVQTATDHLTNSDDIWVNGKYVYLTNNGAVNTGNLTIYNNTTVDTPSISTGFISSQYGDFNEDLSTSRLFANTALIGMQGLTSQGEIAAPFFTAASTTATSTFTNLIVSSAGGSGTRCAQFGADGTLSANASACGGSSSPGGLNTQVQYNNAGSFAGNSTLTYDSTALTIGPSMPGGLDASERLKVTDDTGANSDVALVVGGGNGDAVFGFGASGGTIASPTKSTNNQALGDIYWEGYTGSSWVRGANISGIGDTITGSNVPVDLTFSTTPTNSLIERMRITSTGNVGIGTPSPLSKLAVSGGSSIGADYNIAAPTNGLIVEGNVGIASTTPTHSLSVGNFLSMDSTGAFNVGYSPITMYQDSFGSLIHLTGNPGYYFPRMLNVNYAPPDNVGVNLGDQETGASYELPVNTGCWNGNSYDCAQGIEIGTQRYTKVGTNYYSNINYINAYKRTTGTTTPIAISFENKDLNSFENRYVAEYLDPSGATAIGGYASTTSNSANRYDLTIPLQVSSSTATTNFAVDSSPRTHLFVVNENGKVGIATSSPSQMLTLYSTSNTPSLMITNTNTGGAASLNISPDGTTANGFSLKQYGSAIGSGLNNTSEFWNFNSSGNSGMRFGGSNGEAMRIDTINSRVGIGTTTPGTLLDLFSSATTTMRVDSNSTTQGSCIILKDVGGSGYTEIYTKGGTVLSKVATSPTTCN